MDIAKYIGLYLLKNNFCYIHGLGNLELKKRPATYTDGALNAPSYEVTLSHTGSIDDNLANFIATNEQISISKAANALRDFTTNARAELQAGNEVVIPSIGKFVEMDGRIRFITEPKLQYTPPSIPTIKNSPTIASTTQQKSNYETTSFEYAPRSNYQTESKQVNWGKIIMLIIAIAAVLGAIIFGMNYMQNNNTTNTEVAPPPADTAVAATEPLVSDSTLAADSAAQNVGGPAIIEKDSMLQFRVVLNEYADSASAGKRFRKLASFKNPVEMVVMPDGKYAVLYSVSVTAADTAAKMKELRVNYNPQGVRIYQP
jgi:nucleoid DNA-binding protein